ncbi:MAG: RNA methyltransferase [Proteobacteria bacterium]|nr:RNA methyltransferase [Pseudomonadota bacterium]MBI3497765.1 RNA methyltransferase [Pseudomonadota bacterium]
MPTNTQQTLILSGPAIILVEPQLGENIGTTARAMLNCGLDDLRLVRPRHGRPDERSYAAASGADVVLDRCRLYERVEEAIADLARVYASSGRLRDMAKPVITPRLWAKEARALMDSGAKPGVLFGPERSGLVNDDLALADTVVTVPLNPGFSSLNLAQAVVILGYEWFVADDPTPERQSWGSDSLPAPKAELVNFLERLEAELDDCGFLRNLEQRPSMVRNLRNLFQRALPTQQELRTMHGVVRCLVDKRKY